MKVRLIDGKTTLPQGLIIGAWLANAAIILAIWLSTSYTLLTSGQPGSILTGIGRLLGLYAVFFALTQFLLMGRILWIERRFGLDHLASYHRVNGYYAISCILLHVGFITLGYALSAKISILHQYTDLILHYDDVWLAFIAEILFVAVVGTSIYIVRKHLRFETWYAVHLIVYIAIVTAFFHQLSIGGSFLGHPGARWYWYALYVFVAGNVLFWRFTLPSLNLIRFGFKVKKVVRETPTTTSVYISGRGLRHWRAVPGQYILMRILAPPYWLEEHPFSLSAIVSQDTLRVTIRHVGDYTEKIAQLPPGKPVLIAGPFGRFTKQVATTDKRLFIAGGVGITPLRAMAEEAVTAGQDTILLYGNRTPDDVVFVDELTALKSRSGLRISYIFSDPPLGFKGRKGYVTPELVAELVPDYKDRDIYICGPPVMMTAMIDGLTQRGVSQNRLHYERFSLHA